MPRHVFYGGKGGVGKTTCAAATALGYAERGEETLVVSTDPAHSLADSLEATVESDPREVQPGLWAAEVDPDERAEKYRGAFEELFDDLSTLGLGLGEDDIDALLDAGLAPGGDEVAALDLLTEYEADDRFDRVVFDTAPTGHALRLLELPDVLSKGAETASGVRKRVKRMSDSVRSTFVPGYYYASGGDDDRFDDIAARMARAGAVVRDPDRTEFRVVTIPETMAVHETRRLVERLDDLSIPVTAVVINRVLEEIDEDCARCRSRRERQQHAVAEIRARFSDYDVVQLPELDAEARGHDTLAALAGRLVDN
ncbi:arsenite efflux ATP-binding protein ArsA [Natronoarchaeum philippinense]|uniref:Arsenite efflux ATP-binding protein ArsA n=1 Tax=Natronoarchaeum philippinense TaxID=558529 RepID=A0A285PBJ6_NATPI|nr:ArsA family ATPase [Natronoarchaeum philippinense]SNZ17231.1 arsenite efflux ATP-binding protein ArsA [Natronoarchaeum philippinense]